ncbi:MAG: response regulator transcription factor [Planctomycetes bacterium]|nr:response regulator transcription factor [Planctomycetota bacterium]
MTNKKTVLIVEDDADVRLGLSVLLGREFEVVGAEDSISALIAARRVQPDVIVLDLGLPGGDGLEVLNRLRDIPELATTPTLVVTGRDGDHVENEALSRGAVRLFQKPADPRELIETIRSVTSHAPTPRREVLIVDDDKDTRESLAVRMRAEDFTVSFAEDGATALMNARRSRPDLVLLDLGLPCGDGVAVLQRMRAMEDMADVAVIVLSGREADEACRDAVAAGADVYLQKPVDGAELVEAVRAVL